MTLGPLDPSKPDTLWGVRGANIEVPVTILAALLRAVGGRIVLDAFDLAGNGSAPRLSMFEVRDPFQIVLTLEEGE